MNDEQFKVFMKDLMLAARIFQNVDRLISNMLGSMISEIGKIG